MFVKKYNDDVSHYLKKHLVEAGLTTELRCMFGRNMQSVIIIDVKIIVMIVFRGLVHKNVY